MANNVKQTNAPLTSRVLHYYWKATRAHLPLFAGLVCATFLYIALLSYANPYIMSLVVDKVSAGGIDASNIFDVFWPFILALVCVNVFGQFFSKAQDYLLYKLEIAVNFDLANMAFDALCEQSMNFHANNLGGTLVSQTSKFMSAYNQIIETLNWPFTAVFTSIVATCVVLLPQTPLFVGILMLLLVVYALVSYYLYKRILNLNEQAAGAQNNLSGEIADSVANILAVKTCGREDYERELFGKANREVVARDSRRMRASLTRGIITACITVAIMTFVSVFIAGGNAWFGISAGTLVVMFTYTYNITNQFNFINSGLQRFNRAFGDASGMAAILDEPKLVTDVPGASDLRVTRGEIRFEGVGFNYEEESTEVFEGFNLNIAAGEHVGLVGVSGSGKTTLTKLLLRLTDVQEGKILIDGQNISECTQISLRTQIAYVPQEPLLFHRSVRENISYGRPSATAEEVRLAAKRANALDFIEALPHGFDTITGERGVKLSGGQKQRIAIARAILADCPILVLDEATSALDSESEAYVQDALGELMRGRTSIVVAHRLSTVAALDRIVVLRGGRIVEAGSHAQLLERGGEYARLWSAQTSSRGVI